MATSGETVFPNPETVSTEVVEKENILPLNKHQVRVGVHDRSSAKTEKPLTPLHSPRRHNPKHTAFFLRFTLQKKDGFPDVCNLKDSSRVPETFLGLKAEEEKKAS